MFVKLAAEGLEHGHERRHWGGMLSEFILAAWVFDACHAGSTGDLAGERDRSLDAEVRTIMTLNDSRSLSGYMPERGNHPLHRNGLRETSEDCGKYNKFAVKFAFFVVL